MTCQGNRWQCPSLTSVVAKFSSGEKFSLIWNHGHISVIAWCSKLKKFNTARSIRRRDWCWKIVASHRTHLTLCGCNWCACQLHISLHLYMDFPLGQCRNATPYLAECTFGYQTLILGIYLLALGAFGSWQFSVNLLAWSMVICLKSVWNWILTWYCFATICIIIMVFLGVSNDFDLRVWLLPQVVLLGSYYGWRCLTFLHCAQCVFKWYTFLPVNLMILICECEYCPRWLCQVIITGGTSWLFSVVFSNGIFFCRWILWFWSASVTTGQGGFAGWLLRVARPPTGCRLLYGLPSSKAKMQKRKNDDGQKIWKYI